MLEMWLEVNCRAHVLSLDPRTTLLDALREHLHLTGYSLARFEGQIVAIAVAETRERAEHAARTVRVRYAREPHVTDLRAAMFQAQGQRHPAWCAA